MRSRLLTLIGVAFLVTSVLISPTAMAFTDGTVAAEQKISDLHGGFGPGLDDYDEFARSVANIGDFDGDGVTDIAVGQSGDDDAGTNAGAMWLVMLNADGTVKSTTKIVPGQPNMPTTGARNFGVSMTSLGDLDGDGVIDLAVGNQREDGGLGAVWILFLNGDGTVKGHQKIGQGKGGFSGSLQRSANFGFSTTNMGDLDGNGVVDLAVGAPTEVNGTGEVWILFMQANGTVLSDQRIAPGVGGFTGGVTFGDQFGEGVANIGDLDNDGTVDLAVTAQLDDDGGADRGAVYVLFMNPEGTVASHQKVSSTAGGLGPILDNYDKFGTSAAAMGDLDGDGTEDLVVGGFDEALEGAVWILFMNPDGTVASTQRISEGVGGFVGPTDPGELFGWSVAGLGDFNNDGSTDLAVGEMRDNDGGPQRGAIWLLFLEPLNEAPQVAVDSALVEVAEGGTAVNSGTVADADGDEVVLTVSIGTIGHAPGDGTWNWEFETDDGPAEDQTVTVTAEDGNGGSASVHFQLRVHNAEPEAVFGNDGPVDEGSDFILSLTSPVDPSAADTAAGFSYSFDCGDGAGAGPYGPSDTAVCPTDDSGVRNVVGYILDKDGGRSDYAAIVTVDNVAPTATFLDDGPVGEGTPFTLSLVEPSDPSPADTAAGFEYAFDCGDGSGVGAFGTEPSVECATTDDDVRSIAGHVRDKDGAATIYVGTVTVDNVAPDATIEAVGDDNGDLIGLLPDPGLLALPIDMAGILMDEGHYDTHVAEVDWGDTTVDSLGPVEIASSFYAQHTYYETGNFVVDLEVTDDDGGVGTDTYSIDIVDMGGAIDVAAGRIATEASDPNLDPSTLVILDDAVDRLAVARAKWDEGKPKVAADNVRKAIEFLNAADAADDELYTEYIENFLARATKSAAVYTIWYATSIGADQALIDSALALVAEGDALRAAGDYVGAALAYRDAIGVLDDTLDQPSGDIYAAGEAVVVAEKAAIEAIAADPATASKAVGPLEQAAGLLGDALVAIAADDPGGAIGFIRGALGKVERAEAKDGNLDLASVRDSLAGAGASLAGDAVAFATSNAVVAADFQAIDAALGLIVSGDADRAVGEYANALEAYKMAAQTVNYLI